VMLGINNAGVYKYTLFGLYFVLIAWLSKIKHLINLWYIKCLNMVKFN
jgi:hypothetical protein